MASAGTGPTIALPKAPISGGRPLTGTPRLRIRRPPENTPGDMLANTAQRTDRMIKRPNWVEPRVSSPVIEIDAPELDGTCAVIELLATRVVGPGPVVGARWTGGAVDWSRPHDYLQVR